MPWKPSRSPVVQLLVAPLADANAPSVFEPPRADASRLVAAAAHRHHVRDVDRAFLLDDSAGILGATRLGVALLQIEPFDDDALAVGQDAQDLAGLPALPPGDDHDGIVLADTRQCHC